MPAEHQHTRDLICEEFQYGGVDGGANMVDGLLAAGMSLRDVYLKLLGPVAHQFDTLWNEDRVPFLNVSTATMRMEATLDRNFATFAPIALDQSKRAVFASLADDEHTIGIKMAANIQRTKGWDVQLLLRGSATALLPEIEQTPAQVLGLSIGSSASLPELATILRTVRRRRPDMKILVSGPLVANGEHPLHLLNADAIAASFDEAEGYLDEMVEQA